MNRREPVRPKPPSPGGGALFGRNDYGTLIRELTEGWKRLCDRYLPVRTEDSIWRYSGERASGGPDQGWKLHISATVLSANKVLERIGPLFCELGIPFKAPGSLDELSRINCGLYYGFSQVGKFITVYPRSDEQAVFLARKLHRLTHDTPGPTIPYDLRYRENSRVFYRYGAYSPMYIETEEGARIPAMRDPKGELVSDLRAPGAAAPYWVTDPFVASRRKPGKKSAVISPLKTTIRAYEALSQRGKGGVYRALDLSVLPARLCILKEGRRYGEVDWAGRDGCWRVRHEAGILASLLKAGVAVPQIYTCFDNETNHYLAMEFIEGRSLHAIIAESKKKIPLHSALRYALQLARLMNDIHSAGWVWRDCKPLNLILTRSGELRPIDFEGACPVDEPDELPWGTAGYAPPEWVEEPRTASRIPEDLHALGATIYHLLAGRIPDEKNAPVPIGRVRRHVPASVREILSALLDPDPGSRPSARVAAKIFKAACSEAGPSIE